MMAIAPAIRTSGRNTTEILKIGRGIVEHSRALDLLPQKPETNVGRPAVHGQYNLCGVFCTMFEHMYSGHAMSMANVTRALWFDYTDEQMAIIGLEGLRTPQRVLQMKPLGGRLASREQLLAAERAIKSECQRFYDFCRKNLAVMDDTPLPGKWAKADRPTRAQVRAARLNPDLDAPRELAGMVLNRILMGSLMYANEARFPGASLHEGLLRDHLGDVAVDETHVTTGIVAAGEGFADDSAAPANMLAEAHPKNRRTRSGPAMGLTLALTAARSDRARVPNVALAMALHEPTGGDRDGLLNAVRRLEENGLRPLRRGNAQQYVIGDQGYSRLDGMNRALHAMGYSMVMEYPKNARVFHDLGLRATSDEGPAVATTGPYLFQGRIVCPGIGRDLIAKGRFTAKEWMTDEQIREHDDKERLLTAATMRTNGRPKEVSGRKRGGQRKGEKAPEPMMQVTVACPAVRGQVRCPIIAETMEDQTLKGKPLLHAAPWQEENRPSCCENDETRIVLTDKQFKQWQPHMAGTWEHFDLYGPIRSRNEAFNSRLGTPHEGGNLRHESIAFRNNAMVGLAIAFSVAAANIKEIESFDSTLIRNRGLAPIGTGPKRRERRTKALSGQREGQRAS